MGDEEAHLALPGRRVQARGAHGRSPPAWEPGARGAHLHSPPRALRPAGAFKRRSLAAKPGGRAKGWGRGLGGQPASRGSATAPDLSQDERQSRRPEPQAAGGSGQGERRGAPVPARRALALGLGCAMGEHGGADGGSEVSGGGAGQSPRGPASPSPPPALGTPGSLAAPVLVLQETVGATWEEAVAWKLWEAALGGHKGDIHSQDWQAGSGGSGRGAGPPGCLPFPGDFPPFLAGAQTGGKSSPDCPFRASRISEQLLQQGSD